MGRGQKPPKPADPEQFARLVEAAREHGADMHEPQFGAALRKVAQARPQPRWPNGASDALSSTLHILRGGEPYALIQKKPSLAMKSSAASSGRMTGPKSPGVAQLSRRHHRTCTRSC